MRQIQPLEMPKSVTSALAKIWTKGIPSNIRDICYTYGDICYTPTNLSKDLEVHEEVHSRQQGDNPDAWWFKYGNDPEFRYAQELEAYRAQYAYLRKVNKRKAFKIATYLARDLSSPMYGGICSYQKALLEITRDIA